MSVLNVSKPLCVRRLGAIAAFAIAACGGSVMPNSAAPLPQYEDTKAPLESRVNDLYNRLTEKEKLSMLAGTAFTSQPLPRLGLKGMQFADAGQGVRGGSADDGPDPIAGPATAFPSGVSMASSWDRDLMRAVGKAIGEEARNKGTGVQIELGPAVNIHRSPLNGRDSEYLSEDPYLNARLVVPYIEGMQSTGTGACVKHFACNNEETDRGDVNVIVDERTLREIYLPAFEAAVKEAHVWSVMAAYNKVNGPFCTANWFLMTNVLRRDWGFDGFVMSDWGAVHQIARVVNAGTDLEMPNRGYLTASHLQSALNDGSITQEEVDRAVKNILRATIRTGLADPIPYVPNHSVVGSASEQAVAYQAGVEGMVLLKNNSILPLNPNTIKSLAIIGPRSKKWQFDAWGSPGLTPTTLVTPYQGITARLAGNRDVKVLYNSGSGDVGSPVSLSDLTTPDGSEHGFSASYYNNQELSGVPVRTETDPDIDFDWTNDTRPIGVNPVHFSARWQGVVTAPTTGKYTFKIKVDDGCRLYVSNRLIVDDWNEGGVRTDAATVDLTAGQKYSIRLEYFQSGGDASISMRWLTPNDTDTPYEGAVEVASHADYAIVIVGSEPEAEGSDRKSMDLPNNQDQLIRAVAAVNPHTIVVLNNGSPLLLNPWIDNVPAVLDAGFSGELGGKALAAILFGDENPSGKLVDTYGVHREDYPDYPNFPGVKSVVHYTEGLYVGYRAFDKRGIAPLFPFGYGLSYTTFRYSNVKVQHSTWTPSGSMEVSAQITNTGARKGAEVAELYVEPQNPLIDRPIRELKGFERVTLSPGQTKTVQFTLTPRDFAYCDVPGKQWRADSGNYKIEVGSSSRDLKLTSSVYLKSRWTQAVPGIGATDPYAPIPSLATGKPSTASSYQQDNLPSYAFDNDDGTRWESQGVMPQWLQVDLQQPTTFNTVKIVWEAAFAKSYELQSSDDGLNWRTIYSTTSGAGGVEAIPVPTTTARYVRLYVTEKGTKFAISLYSFDIINR